METHNIPASLKDGMLQYEAGFSSLAIDKASGNITTGKTEYKKIK
jgi:hypothetical protein